MSEIGTSNLISDSTKIRTLKYPNLRHKVAWFMFIIGTAQLALCLKTGQTELGHFGYLGSYIF